MVLPALDLTKIPSSLHHPEPGVLHVGVLEQEMGILGHLVGFHRIFTMTAMTAVSPDVDPTLAALALLDTRQQPRLGASCPGVPTGRSPRPPPCPNSAVTRRGAAAARTALLPRD